MHGLERIVIIPIKTVKINAQLSDSKACFRRCAHIKEEVMGFFRKQQENMAVRLLEWRYQRMNVQAPPIEQLQEHARQLVDDAHRIAKERGRNVMAILTDLVEDIKKR